MLILFVSLLISLTYLRKARIFSTSNKEKKIESLLGKPAIFKMRHEILARAWKFRSWEMRPVDFQEAVSVQLKAVPTV